MANTKEGYESWTNRLTLMASYGLCSSPHMAGKNGCDGLTEEQLHYRPTKESNPIAWLVWHLSRVKDRVTTTISSEGEVWVTERWNERGW